MYDQKVMVSDQFPIPEKQRQRTDIICTIIGAIFALLMFIMSIVLFSRSNYNLTKHPTDSFGKACDAQVLNRPYLYFTFVNNVQTRQCVSSCPLGTQGYFIDYGFYCLDKDEAARNKILENPQLASAFDYENVKATFGWTVLISLGWGVLWMVFVHCFSRHAPIVAIVGGAIFALVNGILLLVLSQRFWDNNVALKILAAIICFILFIILVVMIAMYYNEVKFQGLFLQYSVRFLNENPLIFLYIPVFIILTFGLVVLILWQNAAFRSSSVDNTDKNLFYRLGCNFWSILNVFEFIWGLQFLRDAFNFCVSGSAVDWYWGKRETCYIPYKRLISRNWGSVVGGSFLNAFFQIPTLIVQLLVCHPQACCPKLGTTCYSKLSCLTCFFDLVRTDAYSYINLSGIPFCNAARQCKLVCDKSNHFIGTHSSMKHYRFAAHAFNVGLLFLICHFILKHKTVAFDMWHVAFVIVIILMCVTYFIAIHADTAQGLQTSFLVEHELEQDYQYMHKCLPSVKNELKFIDRGLSIDGKC